MSDQKTMPSQRPLVSVIIPAFNCAKFITETLESVYFQTYTNWEIVVIDDGSTDNTKAVLAAHREKIRYFYQENKGTAAARNAGLRKARGELIAFLDNDDLWLPEKLEMQIAVLQNDAEIGLVFTDGTLFGQEGILKDTLISKRLQRWVDAHEVNNRALAKGWIGKDLFCESLISSATSVLARKELFDVAGGFDEGITIADDYDLWLRLAQCCPVAFLRCSLYWWRYRAESASGAMEGRDFRWMRASIPVLEKNWPIAPKEIQKEVRRHLASIYWKCGWLYFQRNEYRNSRKMFRGYLRHNKLSAFVLVYLLASCFSPKMVNKIRFLKRHAQFANEFWSNVVSRNDNLSSN